MSGQVYSKKMCLQRNTQTDSRNGESIHYITGPRYKNTFVSMRNNHLVCLYIEKKKKLIVIIIIRLFVILVFKIVTYYL